MTSWTTAHQASLSFTISLEFAQTHTHWVGDAIQTSRPLSPPSPAFNLSQHQGLFQWVSSSHQVTKVLEYQFQHQSFQWIFRIENCACMCAKVASVVSDSLWFYGLQPARLFCPWDSPGKNVVSHNCLDAFISASSNHVWREGLRFKKRSIIASDSSREGFHSPWKEDGRERNGNARKTLLSKKERLVDTQLGWGVAARKVIFLYDYILQKWHLLKNFVQKSYCMVVVGSMMKLWYGKHNDKRSETYREGRDKAPILWT